ncbi:DNA-directed RNA polymerase I subunit RPA34 [Candoia aspera]|uniref:DNA-directed RNA polymerase I subunit RPA34 n=1 Tax=Candoia aspera TaxID=51853 RepID=UPI002FD7FBA4
MEPPGRRGGGAARGSAGMDAPGGAAAGPPRFQCPEEFCARRFAPGPALCPETLRGPAKQLLLIRAPASFSPESLTGHTMPPCSSHTVKASQLDGTLKVYSLQMSLEDPGSSARLLIPSGQPGHLICAPPFSGSLSIWERYGDPSATQPLFPVAGRPAPQAPEGLKQRFFPFGGWPKRPPHSSEALEKTARKKSKKRRLQMAEGGGALEQWLPLKHESWGEGGSPKQLPGCLMEPVRGLLGEQTGTGHKQHPLKAEAAEAVLPAPGASGQLLGQNVQPRGHLEEGLLPGGLGDPERRKSSKRKQQQQKNRVETEGLPDRYSRGWLPGEMGPEQGGGGDPAGVSALGGCMRKQQQREKVAEGLQDAAAIEDPGDTPCLGSLLEESLGSAKEEPGGGLPGCKKKKKSKKEKGDEELLQKRGRNTVPGVQLPCAGLGCPGSASVAREVGPEEPLQPDGAAPNQKPKKRRRGEGRCRGRAGPDFLQQAPKGWELQPPSSAGGISGLW